MNQRDFMKIPEEVAGRLESLGETLSSCELLDMQKLASASGTDEERFDAHLDAAQLYVDVSRYVQALMRVVYLCEGKVETTPTVNLRNPQDRIDKARGRYEKHLKAKKRELTLGIEDAHKVISAVNKSKRKTPASAPVNVAATKATSKKRKGKTAMEKHRTMEFLDGLKRPT